LRVLLSICVENKSQWLWNWCRFEHGGAALHGYKVWF